MGVTNGFAQYNCHWMTKIFGEKNIKPEKIIKIPISANKSLIVMYGWKGTVSLEGFFISIPTGLLFPGTCKSPYM